MPEPTVNTGHSTVPLWLWMQRHGSWIRTSTTFCSTVTADPDVADYCRAMDPDDVRQHCARVLTTLCVQGLTESRLRALVAAHREVTTADGRALSHQVVDRVTTALTGALAAEGVPTATLDQVVALSVPIRDALTDRRSLRRIRRDMRRCPRPGATR